jgi:hypothetical protein
MIAVVQSNCIEGLNESNIMPYWYHTSHWRTQYPKGSNVGAGNITLSILRETHRPAKDYKLCPGISGPRKGGRLNKLQRLMSFGLLPNVIPPSAPRLTPPLPGNAAASLSLGAAADCRLGSSRTPPLSSSSLSPSLCRVCRGRGCAMRGLPGPPSPPHCCLFFSG